jgi:hypothetical protein
MRRPRLASSISCAVSALALLPASARGGDDAKAPPPAGGTPTISGPVLDGLVGSWDVAWKGMGMEGRGFTRVRKAAGGQLLVQDTRVVVEGQTFYGFNVLRLEPGAKRLRFWRTDTVSGAEMVPFQGALAEDGFEVTSAGGSIRYRKTASGYEATFVRGGETAYASTYTQSVAEVEPDDAPNAPKAGWPPAAVGTWDVTGEWVGETSTKVRGKSSLKWVLGGLALSHDYERTTALSSGTAFGVWRWSPDGASARSWWFESDVVEPKLAEGPMTADGWRGKGKMPNGSAIELIWSKKGEGFEMRFEIAGNPAGSETYVRKK